ncbi:MAG: GAP family protein [Thermoleophilia bacterium]|nr:GAP family protein [Thermoleophilia bacterium]
MHVSIIELVGVSVTVGLSPFPILAIIPLLGDPRGRGRAVALALGWSLGLLAGIIVATAAATMIDDTAGGGSTGWIGWTKAVLGVLLVAVAAKSWHSRPRTGADREASGWLDALASASTARIWLTGTALSLANPKIVVLALGATSAIASGPISTAAGIAVFVVVGSSGMLALLAVAIVDRPSTARLLGRAEAFMTRHGSAIVGVLLAVIGTLLVIDGFESIH